MGICFFISLFALSGKTQSIGKDVSAFLKAVAFLKENNSPDNRQAISAAAELMAILRHYDNPVSDDSMSINLWLKLKNKYARNTYFQGLFNDTLSIFTNPATFAEVGNFTRKLQSGARQKILRTLFSKEAVSPVDYLSVSLAADRYRTPAAPPLETMKTAAKNSNINVKNGLLTSQVEVIKGLALFILDRAKDEVIINFLDQLLQNDAPDFEVLFPSVSIEFGKNDFNFSTSFIDRLRNAFYEDLQTLSVRIPLLLLEDDYFKSLQSDPVAYNLTALYCLIGLAQSGVDLEEAIPVVNRYLYEDVIERTKEINLLVAEKAIGKPDYSVLISLSDSIKNQILYINNLFNNQWNSILSGIESTPADSMKTQVFLAEISNSYPSRNTLDILLDGPNDFGLDVLPMILASHFDAPAIMRYNTLERYDKFFGYDRSPEEWRAAGLEICQKLNGAWFKGETIVEILNDRLKDIENLEMAANRWIATQDSNALDKIVNHFETDLSNLREAIDQSKKFWKDNSGLNENQSLGFDLLKKIISDDALKNIEIGSELDGISTGLSVTNIEIVKVERKRKLLTEVEKRLFELDSLQYLKDTKNSTESPVKKYIQDHQAEAPYVYHRLEIAKLEKKLEDLQRQQLIIDSIYADLAFKARNNAGPILQITELASNLMYCLRSDDAGSGWLTQAEMDSLLDGEQHEAVFLGLMGQLLENTRGVGPISRKGLSDLIRLTIKDLDLVGHNGQPEPGMRQDSLAFYKKVSFAVNIFNHLIELPLLTDKNDASLFKPLKDRSKALAGIPDISEQALNFIYFLNIKKHSRAVGALIRLFTQLDLTIQSTKGKNKRKPAIQFLHKYGDFIAGLIDAEKSDQVKELLLQVADPPGSSRIKRISPLTVGINSYLGGTLGWESWKGNPIDGTKRFTALAPTMPLGITISKLFGRKQNSFSFYISFLDLGAVINYQTGAPDNVESELTFKNMFKPGVQFHWNIKRSPFYLGAGWQHGPQFISGNNGISSLKTDRYFIAFGIDVSLFTFYRS